MERLIEVQLSTQINELTNLCRDCIPQITAKVIAMKKYIQIMKADSKEVRTRMDTLEIGITRRIDTIEVTLTEQYTKVVDDKQVRIARRN